MLTPGDIAIVFLAVVIIIGSPFRMVITCHVGISLPDGAKITVDPSALLVTSLTKVIFRCTE